MPGIERLARENGVIYTCAYSPGTKSPSSHGSFFTGELPSRTGMHEAYPFFDGSIPTIAETMAETHHTHLITSNAYILNGLERGFDAVDDLVGAEYMLFREATDPRRFANETDDEARMRKYIEFLRTDGKPIRSLLNGLNFKRIRYSRDSVLPLRGRHDRTRYQFSRTIRRSIEETLAGTDDAFIVANSMCIHPPLDASDEALDRFCGDRPREELPIGVNGKEVLKRLRDGGEGDEIGQAMHDLVKAATWDVDRNLAPLVESLVEQGAFVVLTADHGTWFHRSHRLDEDLLHVPLVLFAPDEPARTVENTVNLRSLPRTTMSVVHGAEDIFSGQSLLDVNGDRTSITEYIAADNSVNSPVDVYGASTDDSTKHEIAAIKGDTRVDFREGQYTTVRGQESVAAELRDTIADNRRVKVRFGGEEPIQYDETTKQRLREFGYL